MNVVCKNQQEKWCKTVNFWPRKAPKCKCLSVKTQESFKRDCNRTQESKREQERKKS